MAYQHGNNAHSESARMEQIITEFFAKGLHIILESRCPYVSSRNYSGEQALSTPSPSSSTSSSSSFRPRDKWFNLALRDCPAALENIDFWRQSNLEPMVVDIISVRKQSDWEPLNCSPKSGIGHNLPGKERYYYGSENEEYRCESKTEKIVERWVLQYESKTSGGNWSGVAAGKRSACTSSHTVYKKLILLLRSLYTTVRLLPAYRLFRDLISSAQIRWHDLGHRVSSFVKPFTSREEADMQHLSFTPVDTSCGRLRLSVSYCSSTLETSSGPSTPISPQFIPEYVGSPMAEPLKRFPSGSTSQNSPSPSSFGRRHSWSYGIYRGSPPSAHPIPSPTYSESHTSLTKQRSYKLPPASLPHNLPYETSTVHGKSQSHEECWPYATFSPSTSPSPPTYYPGSHLSEALLCSKSAPVSIPASRFSIIRSLPNNQLTRPSPPMKDTRPMFAKEDSHAGHKISSPIDKLSSFSKQETGKIYGVKPSSNSSPSKSFSRSSSRLSFQDDYDDSDFPGPFFIDEDTMDQCSRTESFDQLQHPSGSQGSFGLSSVKKSQDAAVGALVQMLKKAPPLQQDISITSQHVQESKFETQRRDESVGISEGPTIQHSASQNLASSGLFSSKTMDDALDELRGYRELKDLLLNQGKIPPR